MLITRGFGEEPYSIVSVPISDLTMLSNKVGTKSMGACELKPSMGACELKPSMTGQVEIQDGQGE